MIFFSNWSRLGELNALSFFAGVETRFFSLARHALVVGLRAAGIGPGKTVLLPEFICRDLLASIHEVGASVAYYPVSRDLTPALPPEAWPTSAAVLAVDYFGFPQDMSVFRNYCSQTGALLIEDNAHGFLSRDKHGQWLGLRGDMGIFSIRKTFPMQNGAALVVLREELVSHLDTPLDFNGRGGRSGLRFKSLLRRTPLVGPFCTSLATGALRLFRKLLYGNPIPQPGNDAEISIPLPAPAYQSFLKDMLLISLEKETSRRKALYLEFANMLREFELEPVCSQVHEYIVPYGFVFRSTDMIAERVQEIAKRRGLDVFRWPALPEKIVNACPDYYKQIWVLNFQW